MRQQPQLGPDALWERRFRAAVVTASQLARSAPERGLAVTNRSGVHQLHAWDVVAGDLRPLTDRPDGVVSGWIGPDGRHVYYHHDSQGNELGHLVRLPFEGGPAEDLTPDLPDYGLGGFAAALGGGRLALVAAHDGAYHLYVLDLGPGGRAGAPRRLHAFDRSTGRPIISHDGALVAVSSMERTGSVHRSLIAFDAATGREVGELWDGPGTSVGEALFARRPGDPRVAATTTRSGVRRPLIWDVPTGEREDLEPPVEGDLLPADWSADGDRLLLGGFHRAVQRLYRYDVSTAELVFLDHPPGALGGAYFAPGGEIFAHWSDAAHPDRLIALDGRTGRRTRTVLAAGDAPPGQRWRSVEFASSDGELVQAWLMRPEGDGPFPAILDTHGGPQAVAIDSYASRAQAWVDHGFVFMSLNYRGSTSFGRAYEEKIWRNLGHWEVEDMVAARAWLVRERVARPDAVLLTGWSYGGYLTLMALGKHPELWAGGMAGIAIADWRIQYQDTSDLLRGYQVALLGGTPDEVPEQYAASSPITYVERVAAPVLIVQGRNDTRTPARPVEAYEAKMRALGKEIEVVWFESGHMGAGARVDQAIEHQRTMLRFAHRVLGAAPA